MDHRKTCSLTLSLLGFVLGACAEGESSPDDPYEPILDAELSYSHGTSDDVTIEQIVLNGLTFDVRTAGPRRGDVVILLHGFPESSYEWRHQIPALARAGYRVLAPNLRGYSEGARPTEIADYNLLEYVSDVLALADHAGAFRFHLVGHDVGALVAWGTAQLAGLRLKSLTAVSVPHPGAFAAQLADKDSCQSRASEWYKDAVLPGAAEKLLEDGSILREVWAELDADAVAEYEALLGEPEKLDGALNTWRANFVDGQPQGAYPIPIIAPALYVWGDQDRFNCRDGEPLTRLLSWGPYRFEVLRGVGHFVPEEAPEQFNRLLLTHLRRYRL